MNRHQNKVATQNMTATGWYTAVCVCVTEREIDRESKALWERMKADFFELWHCWVFFELHNHLILLILSLCLLVFRQRGYCTNLSHNPIKIVGVHICQIMRVIQFVSAAVTFKLLRSNRSVASVISLFVSFQLPVANTADVRSGKLQSHINRDHHVGRQ